MAEPYMGQIIAVGFNFAPLGWWLCDGSLKPVSEHTALFALLGTTYGGDGTSTFAIPDLRGRAPLGMGNGPSLSPYAQGQASGVEEVTVLSANMPPHNHDISFSAIEPGVEHPIVDVPQAELTVGSNTQTLIPGFYASGPGTEPLRPSIGFSKGGMQPHENRQPYLVLNYIICWSGIFPSQS
jgi:microcystin-dependent protein